jgi:lipopolysaccharide/colanic/teichoic acid biosynthesis glycosyltransferase
MRDPINHYLLDWLKFLAVSDVLAVMVAWTVAATSSSLLLQQDFMKLASVHGHLLVVGAGGALLYHAVAQTQGRIANRTASGRVGIASVQQAAIISLVVVCAIAFRRNYAVSRTFWLSYLALLPFMLFLGKIYFLRVMRRSFAALPRRTRLLVLGDAVRAGEWKKWFDSLPWYGFQITAQPTVPINDLASDGEPLTVLLPSLERELARTSPYAVICCLGLKGSQLQRLKTVVEEYGAQLLLDLHTMVGMDTPIEIRAGMVPRLTSFHAEPLASPFNRALKRTFDIAVSLPVVLFVLPPLSIAIWMWQRVVSPGSLFFIQERGGRDGQPFRIMKFRSMHHANPDEKQQARPGDTRFYPGGNLIRKLSLDEFPQFINVLMGHMSIVGPRPHMVAHDQQFSQQQTSYRMRQRIKPGITGLAQVKGLRGPLDDSGELRDRLRADLEYAESWNLSLDLQIVVRTVTHVFSFHQKSC